MSDPCDIFNQEEDQKSFKTKLKEATWVPHLFRVGVSYNEYNGEKRQRITVRAETSVDWPAESKYLMEEMSVQSLIGGRDLLSQMT